MTPAEREELRVRLSPARAAIEATINEHEAGFGPRSDQELMDDLVRDGDTVPTKPLLLSEWVLLAAWVDADTGETWTTRVSSEAMPDYRVLGLMAQLSPE